MLRSLEISDLLIIDRLELEFLPGLTVLTGETGAGKSILLDALGFVLGWRGRADLVRSGAAQGQVVAVFEISNDHPAQAILADAGFSTGPELILRRINTSQGRKTAWVNETRASGELLRKLSETLVELHGQHDDRGLLRSAGHRRLLDSFAGLAPMISETRAAWRAMQVAGQVLTEEQRKLAEMAEEEEFLRHSVADLDLLAPMSGEDASLDARRRLMQASARIGDDIAKAATAIGGQGAEAMIADATRWLESVASDAEGRLDEPLDALLSSMNELARAEQGIADCLALMAFDPADLDEVEERLFAIRAMARKHDVLPDELGDFAQTQRAQLAALDKGEADLAVLQQALQLATKRYTAVAAGLGARRRSAAKKLDKAMIGELRPLKMENARFTTEITAAPAGPEGSDSVAFTVSTNPGAPAGPISEIASGGELSRFLLALKVCLTRDADDLTMIFDEIDRGVGGATADAVGRRLAALADGAQVLVVTHSPQVAARGLHHWKVSKTVAGGVTTSDVSPLDAGSRLDEVARMLAGDTITKAARDAAQVLLSD